MPASSSWNSSYAYGSSTTGSTSTGPTSPTFGAATAAAAATVAPPVAAASSGIFASGPGSPPSARRSDQPTGRPRLTDMVTIACPAAKAPAPATITGTEDCVIPATTPRNPASASARQCNAARFCSSSSATSHTATSANAP